MKVFRRAGFWLATLGLLVTCAGVRAAVMTTNVQIVGTGPFDIKYILGQDVTSLKIDIVRASDTVTVRSWDSSVAGTFQGADLLKGSHTLAAFWNGKDNGGVSLPQGSYYARVTTASTAAVTAMTLLSGPTKFTASPGKTEARNLYGGGANKNLNSPYHNLAYYGSYPSNSNGSNGVSVVSADASSIHWNIGTGTYEFLSTKVADDDYVLAGDQNSTGTIRILNPADGSTVGSDLSLNGLPRDIAVIGDTLTGKAFFLNGTTGGVSGWDFAGAVPTDVITDFPSFSFYEVSAGVPGCTTPQRALAVSKDGNTIYAAGYAANVSASACLPAGQTTVILPAFVAKYSNSGGTWTRTDFTANLPGLNRNTTPPNLKGVALSPDEKILWVSLNCTSASLASINYVIGLDAQTGVPKGDAYTYAFYTGSTINATPQGLAVTSGGNIYVACWNGSATGTTANSVAILAPPDTGSSDVTRSVTYDFGPPLQGTVAPTVSPITYHDGTVTWSTDGVSDSTVKYGTAPGTLDKTASSVGLVTDHSVVVGGLAQNTKYYFQAISTATGRSPYISPVLDFTTAPLNISNVAVSAVTDNSVTLTFDTDDYSNSWVDLGLDGSAYPIRYGTDTVSTTSLSHTLVVRGLKFGTMYHFKVETGWPGAPAVYTPDSTFKTLDYVQITGESLVTDAGSANLTYTTNIAAAATVNYGTDPAALTSTIPVASGLTHTVVFPSLAAGTTYYYTQSITGGTSVARTTRVSAFTTQVASSPASSVTDNSLDKFVSGLATNVTLGSATGLITLDKQSLPGKPVASPNKIPQGTRYQGWAQTNGYLYLIGGYDATGGTSDKVYVAKINADGTTGAWAETSPLPSPRKVITSQCIGYQGTVYCISGDQTDGNIVPDVYYAKQNADGTLQPWQTTVSIIRERDIASTAIVDGCIVVTGGEPNDAGVYSMRTNYLATLQPDGSIGAWYEITPPTEAIYLQRTVANAGMFYNLGGLNDTDPVNGKAFNSTTDTSYTQPDSDLTPGYRNPFDLAHLDSWMDSQHYGFGATLAGGKIFSLGGRISVSGGNTEVAHTKIAADGLTGAWVVDAANGTANALPVAIYDNDAVTYNGSMYVSPGRLTGNLPNDVVQVVPLVPEASGYAYTGTLEGRIIDLGSVQNLSHIKVTGTGVTASSVAVRYRYAGATGGFSNWFTAGIDANINGGARYVQYQLVLKGDGTATPVVSSVQVSVGPYSSLLPGDIDKSGVVDANDVKMALRIAAGLLNANDPSVSFANGNVVADSVIDILDATAIQRKINGK
ncbi:MAG TPA: hypothetical protein VGM51_00445 [Armatimonadota bacterium]|jgi:hypothetical protein